MKNATNLKIAALVDTLIVTLVMLCLFIGIINPVVSVLALLMPVWLIAGLALWCSAL